MTIFDDLSLRDRIERFRATAIADVYEAATFIDWGRIDAELSKLEPAITRLGESLRAREDNKGLAAALLEQPMALQVLYRLLSVSSSAAFGDGRELPERLPPDPHAVMSVVELLDEIGVWRVIPRDRAGVEQGLQVALLAEETRRRGFRRRRLLETRIQDSLRRAASQAQQGINAEIAVVSPRAYPEPLRSRVEAVVLLDEQVIAAIATLFETYSGGRQQRELAVTLPSLQTDIGLPLVVIADGRAVRDAPDATLERLFSSVAACMTLKEASTGRLAEAITNIAQGTAGPARLPIDALIGRALQARETVDASELPVPEDDARLALGSYFARHSPQEALLLSPRGDELRWVRGSLVPRLATLVDVFDSGAAIKAMGDLLGAAVADPTVERGVWVAAASFRREDPVLGSTIALAAVAEEPDEQTLREVARIALQAVPEGHATLVATPEPTAHVAAELQRVLPVSVVLLSAERLTGIARSTTSPRDAIIDAVLEQSDLGKISPFVLNAAAPRRIFFGREAEEATILTTLVSGSVSVLGGRRIGKTSLLHRVREVLPTVGLTPFFGDCQTVRTWDDFARMARREWNVRVPARFVPDHLFNLVEQLRARTGDPPVLLLDEVDQLLRWDASHEAQVPEAFVRACRALSQQRQAQFVLSGERVISQRIWDAQSPHWNFTHPLMLRQLRREDAEALFVDPLLSLRVQLTRESQIREAVWKITSGHPQIVQFLGDRTVHRLNTRSADARSLLSVEDVEAVAATYEFQEHFLETYWGQSTPLERLLSVLVGSRGTRPDLQAALTQRKLDVSGAELQEALHMLELYGILDGTATGFTLRAEFLTNALNSYGGAEAVIADMAADVRTGR